METKMNKLVFKKAVKLAGSQTKLAEKLGVTPQLICNIKRGSPASPAIVKKMEDFINEMV
jgi:DNA-binding transcriptional regulator YdaS (Cro superfamily)